MQILLSKDCAANHFSFGDLVTAGIECIAGSAMYCNHKNNLLDLSRERVIRPKLDDQINKNQGLKNMTVGAKIQKKTDDQILIYLIFHS